MRRVLVDPEAPQRDAIDEAAKWIRNGGLVALPTDTLYGLAADPFRRDAVARVFVVKGRAEGRGLPLIAADADQILARLNPLSPAAERLAAKFWPGPLTLLVPAPPALVRDVTGGTGRVAVRVPAHDVARAICRAADSPITATSANRSGQPATADPQEVERHRAPLRWCRQLGAAGASWTPPAPRRVWCARVRFPGKTFRRGSANSPAPAARARRTRGPDCRPGPPP